MKNWLRISQSRKNFLFACLVFVLVMSVYLFTLAPSITMEDSAELITAAYTLGIPHPPGFPLYVLLGKLFTFIPLGTIAWRVNLISAVFGALTIALLFVITNKIVKNTLISFCFPLVLAFSSIFWSQSVIAEVYTLNTFLLALLILLLLSWQEKRKDSFLLWFAFIYGLSLTNHTMMILFAPVFTFYILVIDRKIIKRWQLILKMFLLFCLGLSVYFYLFLRAWQKAVYNWGLITDWHGVLAHIMRRQYNDFSPLVNPYGKVGLVISFFFDIYQQFFLPTLLLALAGAVYIYKKNRPFFLLSAGIFLLNSIGIIYLRKYGWALGIDYTYRVYYLPAFLVLTIWLAAIVAYLYDFLSQAFKTKKVIIFRIIQLLFFLVLFSLPPSFLVANYSSCDLSSFWFNYDYYDNLLESLEPNSVYFTAYDGSLQGDTELFSLIYFKMVENVRPDVDIVTEQNFFYKTVFMQVPKEYFALTFENRRKEIFNLLSEIKNRPLYTNYAITLANNDLGWFSLANGYAYKMYPSLEKAKQASLPFYARAIRNLDEVDDYSDYPTAGLAAHYYYNLAAYYLTQGDKNRSQHNLIRAFNLDTAPFSHEYIRFLDYRTNWLSKN